MEYDIETECSLCNSASGTHTHLFMECPCGQTIKRLIMKNMKEDRISSSLVIEVVRLGRIAGKRS